ncbi:MAG: hypothetical protein D6675_10395, partial [Gemmatimonadetes bacterium]
MSEQKTPVTAEQIEQAILELEQHDRKYGEFWVDARKISQMFKDAGHLLREDRERLWDKFSNLCEETRTEHEELMQIRQLGSFQQREKIETKIHEAVAKLNSAENGADIRGAKDLLNEALKWLTEGVPVEHEGDHVRMFKEDKDVCWKQWRDVNDLWKMRREEMWNQTFEDANRRATAIREQAETEDPYAVLNTIKQIQSEFKTLYLGRAQREKLRKTLNAAWDRANERIDQIRSDRQRRDKVWKQRQMEHIDRWQALIAKNKDVIYRLEQQIIELEKDIETAWSDNFVERAQNWIQEKRNKIEDIQKTNAGLEEKIARVIREAEEDNQTPVADETAPESSADDVERGESPAVEPQRDDTAPEESSAD